jgi:hypothetical protein
MALREMEDEQPISAENSTEQARQAHSRELIDASTSHQATLKLFDAGTVMEMVNPRRDVKGLLQAPMKAQLWPAG